MRHRFVLVALWGAIALAAAVPAAAQGVFDFPRVGLSASSASWVDTLTVGQDDTFDLYVCAFGQNPGDLLDQPLSEISWVVYQVCCGASMNILAIDLNPAFTHVGEGPLSGMTATAPVCVDEPALWLATLTVQIQAPGPGQYLWAAGAARLALDCEGAEAIFMDMPLTITLTDGAAPAEASAWGGLKAQYR